MKYEILTPDDPRAKHVTVWFNGKEMTSLITKMQLYKPNRPYLGTIWKFSLDENGKRVLVSVNGKKKVKIEEKRGIIWYAYNPRPANIGET